MKRAIVVLIVLIGLVCLAFGGYLLFEHLEHERALRNYPVAYDDLIAQYAAEFELDPYLVISIMRCESSFDPHAVSNRGAIGLMQIMPDTGEWIAHKLDMDETYVESMLYDPAINVRFGCWYLQFLNGRFAGRWKEMIAAYNAGHRAVENWLKDSAYAPDGALAIIPYESTAAYYERVMTAHEYYLRLYPELFASPVQTASTETAYFISSLAKNVTLFAETAETVRAHWGSRACIGRQFMNKVLYSIQSTT